MTDEVHETLEASHSEDAFGEDGDGLMAVSAVSINETQSFDFPNPDVSHEQGITDSTEQGSSDLPAATQAFAVDDSFATPSPKSPLEPDSAVIAQTLPFGDDLADEEAVNETQGFVLETQSFAPQEEEKQSEVDEDIPGSTSPTGSTPLRDEENEDTDVAIDVPLATQGFIPDESSDLQEFDGTQAFDADSAESVEATQAFDPIDRPESPVPPESVSLDQPVLRPLQSPPPATPQEEGQETGAVDGVENAEIDETDNAHLFDNEDLFSANQPMDIRSFKESDDGVAPVLSGDAAGNTPLSPEVDVAALEVDSTQAFEIPPDDALEQAMPESAEELIENLNKLEGGIEAEPLPDEEQAKELISTIFGDRESDGEEGFEGFGAEDVEKAKETEQAEAAALSDAEDEAREEARRNMPEDFEYDFEKMMRLKKEQNRKRRRRKRGQDVDFINDHDEIITGLVTKMHEAAKDDRHSNENQKPGMRKRKLLPTVLEVIRKRDIQDALIDNGILNAISDWLSPLPDRSLPAYEIRTEFLKILSTFPTPEPDSLKASNLGKTVMILCKHPKENRENKRMAAKLINLWARQIFDIKSDYAALSKEDREQRDYEHMSDAKKRRLSSEGRPAKEEGEEEAVLRPGDKGWIGRARVPLPSSKDYVVRPKWNIEGPVNKERRAKKPVSFVDKKMREFKERTKQSKAMRATNISISGSNMK